MIVLWMIVSYPDEVEPRRSLARGFLSKWEVQPEGELRQMEVNGTLNLPRGFPYPVHSRQLALVPIATSSSYENCNLDATPNFFSSYSLFCFNLLFTTDFPPY